MSRSQRKDNHNEGISLIFYRTFWLYSLANISKNETIAFRLPFINISTTDQNAVECTILHCCIMLMSLCNEYPHPAAPPPPPLYKMNTEVYRGLQY